jgi:hypothetical protein
MIRKPLLIVGHLTRLLISRNAALYSSSLQTSNSRSGSNMNRKYEPPKLFNLGSVFESRVHRES